MPFIDFNEAQHLKVWDGIHGPIFHSEDLTFGHFILEKDVILKEHHHFHEQWTHVIEGELEFTIDGETKRLTSGMVAHMPSNVTHSAVALSRCKVIDCFRPVREDFKTLEKWISPS
jgi:quercetin dioxygenase-like cupin family protein